jgi:hypothetical protein
MTIDLDRFDELVRSIRRSLSMERLSAMAQQTVERQQAIAFESLWKHTPQKTRQTFMTTGHEDHTSIGEGWRLDSPERLPDGARAVIRNVSEHVDVQRTGTTKKDYPITPGKGVAGPSNSFWMPFEFPRLVFWLGPPLKWPVRAARFRKGGFFSFAQVRHPGFGPWGGKDFVEEATDESRPEMARALREDGKQIFKPLREFFG